MRDDFEFQQDPATAAPAKEGVAGYATWGRREMVIGFMAALVAIFVLSLALVFPFADAYGDESAEALLAAGIVQILWYASIVFVVYRLVKGKGSSWRALGLREAAYVPLGAYEGIQNAVRVVIQVRPPRVLVAAVAGYLGAIGLVLVYSGVVEALGVEVLQPDQQIPEAYFENDWLLPVIGVAVVGVAPFVEELFFRGFLYTGLRRGLGVPSAALISGVLFAIAHIDPGLIIPFTLVGIVLAFTYERSGSLAAPIGVHLIFNLVSFLALVLVPEARE